MLDSSKFKKFVSFNASNIKLIELEIVIFKRFKFTI